MKILRGLEFIAGAMIMTGIVVWLAISVAYQIAVPPEKSRPAMVTALEMRVYRECRQRGITDFPSIQMAILEAQARGEK